jgi:hypothetical protein
MSGAPDVTFNVAIVSPITASGQFQTGNRARRPRVEYLDCRRYRAAEFEKNMAITSVLIGCGNLADTRRPAQDG